MDGLPDEILLMIFRDLNISDLFIRCELVCKRWQWLIEGMRFKELIVYQSDHLINASNQYKKSKNIIFVENLDFLHHFKANFINLKYLKINFPTVHFDLDILNEFTGLERLDVEKVTNLNRDVKLCLPKLGTLNLQTHDLKNNDQHTIVIDSSKQLKVFSCNNLSSVRIVHPASVKHLELNGIVNENLIEFTDLELLKVNSTFSFGNSDGLIVKLPINLQKLFFYCECTAETLSNYYEMKIFFNHILEQKRMLGRDVEIYYNGIDLENEKPFANYGSGLKYLELN